jgi:hypothetical protein
MSRTAACPESVAAAPKGGIGVTIFNGLIKLCQGRISTIKVLEGRRHTQMGESSGLYTRTCTEGSIIVSISLSGISLKVDAALCQMSCHRLFCAGRGNSKGAQRIVQISSVRKSKPRVQHPAASLRMRRIDRCCRHPAHTGSDGVAIVMTLNHGNPSVSIHHSRVVWELLYQLLKQNHCALGIGERDMSQNRGPPHRFAPTLHRHQSIGLIEVGRDRTLNIATRSTRSSPIESRRRKRRCPERHTHNHSCERRPDTLKQKSLLQLW